MGQRQGALEDMEISAGFWSGRRVFITGHTGFKGGWLCLWLKQLGASVTGYSLPPETTPNLFELSRLRDGITSHLADIRDPERLRAAMLEANPEVIFHLAAQPLVRASYRLPVDTFATNVMGTVHVLEAARTCPQLKVLQVITTDKVYDNREWPWPYREDEALGGHDPYSASKAACELAVASYRRSFLGAQGISVATARAGNVIGGGDWAQDRVLPDCIRAFRAGRPVTLRRPTAVRPWQHVLEPLAGYIELAQAQWFETQKTTDWRYARAMNFGPDASAETTVGTLARLAAHAWGPGAEVVEEADPQAPHEAGLLTLDPSVARQMLGWRTHLTVRESVSLSVDWYRRCEAGEGAAEICREQIDSYQQVIGD